MIREKDHRHDPGQLRRTLIGIFGEEYETQRNQFRANCFKCGDTTGHLGINLLTGWFHCFKCSYSGRRLANLFKDYLGYVPKIEEYVSEDDLRKPLPFETEPEEEIVPFKGLPDDFVPFTGKENFQGQMALGWLKKRMPMETILKYGIGYCLKGKYKDRIVVPCREDGKVVYFSARSIADRVKPKYLNPEAGEYGGEGKGSVVFNLDGALRTGMAVLCFAPGNMVLTLDGEKNIEDVMIGDFVLTHTNTFKKVLNRWVRPYNGNMKSVFVHGIAFPYTVTPGHRFFARKGLSCIQKSWGIQCSPKCARRNKVRGVIKGCPEFEPPEWKTVDDLEKNDLMCFPIHNQQFLLKDIELEKNSHNHKIFASPIYYSSLFWRIVGLFLGDGTYSTGKSNLTFSINGKVGKQKEFRDSLIEFCQQLKIKYTENHINGVNQFYFCSRTLGRFFARFYNDAEKSIPYHIECSIPENLLNELIYGLYLSDGYMHNEGLRIVNTSLRLLCSVQRSLLRFGRMSVLMKSRKRGYRSKINGREFVAKKDLFALGGSGLGFLGNKTYRNRGRSWVEGEYAFLRIRKIEDFQYSGNVYNLEVEGDHSYCLHQVTSKNCEGVFDAMHIGESGVCIFGTDPSETQIRKLSRGVKKVVVMLDYDARVKSFQVADKFSLMNKSLNIYKIGGFDVRCIVLPRGGDPDEYPRETIFKLIEESKPLSLDQYLATLTGRSPRS